MKQLILSLFSQTQKAKNLKPYLKTQFPNALIQISMPNVGSYNKPVKVQAVNKFKN